MTDGRVAKWHKVIGQFVDAGDLVLEISTDKATIEHHATDPGWLRTILVQEGALAPVGEPLALFTTEEHGEIRPIKRSVLPPKTPERKAISPVAMTTKRTGISASPLAKKLARERGISLEGLLGTGPSGRIMSRDLPQVAAFPPGGEPLSPVRKVIAERLQHSKSTIPHFYVSIDVDARNLSSLREKLKASGQRITINDFVIKATASALMEHPNIRSSFDPGRQLLIRHESADICVAVSVPGGLFTPIVSTAERKSLLQISEEVRILAIKAREGKLQPTEYLGGAFTISNLGAHGVREFYPIINPPQVAILAVGALVDAPIVENGQVVAGKSMRVSLALDHRVLDGTDGALFLQSIKSLLEKPDALSLS